MVLLLNTSKGKHMSLSSYHMKIETGLYTHIALEKHICQLCSQKVQPEEHSACHCPNYYKTRRRYYQLLPLCGLIFCILICSLYLIHSKSFPFTENFAYFGSRCTIKILEREAQTFNHTMVNLMQKSFADHSQEIQSFESYSMPNILLAHYTIFDLAAQTGPELFFIQNLIYTHERAVGTYKSVIFIKCLLLITEKIINNYKMNKALQMPFSNQDSQDNQLPTETEFRTDFLPQL